MQKNVKGVNKTIPLVLTVFVQQLKLIANSISKVNAFNVKKTTFLLIRNVNKESVFVLQDV